MTRYDELIEYLAESGDRVVSLLKASGVRGCFRPEDMAESMFSYIDRPAKRLRPAVLLLASGALGGPAREEVALPAAAGVEVFHTWTLVHDDLIDNDTQRRSGPTVHEAARRVSQTRHGLSADDAAEYGRDVAILTGDLQHGWSITLLADCALQSGVSPILILRIIKHLQSYVLGNLIRGEVLDVQYGMQDPADVGNLDEATIVEMLWLKTGVLYEFAGMAGAMIGSGTSDFDDPRVRAMARFTGDCGTAFQLQDDILGIVGDEASLGKPVGSDIREGKKTVIVLEALKNADESQRETILGTLGNRSATRDAVQAVARLFCELNGIARTKALAAGYIENAIPHLDAIPDSRYRRLLLLWAHYMLDRQF
jgi:geranylgeranyl diphosphate synthase type I